MPGRLDIGDRWPLECGREGIRIECAAWPLGIYNPPFVALMDLQFSFRVAQRNIHPICHVLFLRTQQSLEMASLNLDSLSHSQPCPSAVGPVERRPAAQNQGISTVSRTHSDSVAVAPNINPTECIDLTAESLDPLSKRAASFGDTQMHVKGGTHRPLMLLGVR